MRVSLRTILQLVLIVVDSFIFDLLIAQYLLVDGALSVRDQVEPFKINVFLMCHIKGLKRFSLQKILCVRNEWFS